MAPNHPSERSEILSARISRFTDELGDALIRGRPLKPYVYEELLLDVEHPHPITPGSIQSLIEEASSLRPETLAERPWSASLTDGLGSAVVSLFDIAEAAGEAYRYKAMLSKLCSLSHVDEEDLKLDAKPGEHLKIPYMFKSLRRLHLQSEGSLIYQLGLRLRPSKWRWALSRDEMQRRLLFSSILGALLSSSMREKRLERNELLEEQQLDITTDHLDEDQFEEADDASEFDDTSLNSYWLPLVGPKKLKAMKSEAVDKRATIQSMSAAYGSTVSLGVFTLLLGKLIVRSSRSLERIAKDLPNLPFPGEKFMSDFQALQRATDALSEATTDTTAATDDAEPEADPCYRLEELLKSNPSLLKAGQMELLARLAYRLWSCLKCRDAAGQLEQGNGLLLKASADEPTTSSSTSTSTTKETNNPAEMRRWVSARIFDDHLDAPSGRIHDVRSRFLSKRRNLSLGSKRYILTGVATTELNDGLFTAYSALRMPFGLSPIAKREELNPISMTVMPSRLLNAFNGRALSNLITAQDALSIANQLRAEEQKKKALSRLEGTAELPKHKTISSASLYEQVVSGFWKSEAVDAPFDLSRADVKALAAKLTKEKRPEVEATFDPRDPDTEMDIFEALRAGMEFSALQAELRLGRLMSRVQLNAVLTNKTRPERSPGHGRILLDRYQVSLALNSAELSRNTHHRTIHGLKLHHLKTEAASREKGDTGLQVHMKWWKLQDLLEPLSVASAENSKLELKSDQTLALERQVLDRLLKEDGHLGKPESPSRSFESELVLKPSELNWSPASRELLENKAKLHRAWVEANDWTLRSADGMLKVLDSSFNELAKEQYSHLIKSKAEEIRSSAEHAAKLIRTRKRLAFNKDGSWEWAVHPNLFGLIRERFVRYINGYLLPLSLYSGDGEPNLAEGEADVSASELARKRMILKEEFGRDGNGRLPEAEKARAQFKALLDGDESPDRPLSVDVNVTSDRPFDESVVLQLKVACLDSWAEHKRRLAEIFGDGSDEPDAETEQVADEEFKADEAAVPVPVFHYSRTAVLARGWSEEMLHRLLVSHDYRLLELPAAGNGRSNGSALVIPARWVWEAEEGWAGKLLGAKRRAKQRRKRPATAGKAKGRPNLRKQENK